MTEHIMIHHFFSIVYYALVVYEIRFFLIEKVDGPLSGPEMFYNLMYSLPTFQRFVIKIYDFQ